MLLTMPYADRTKQREYLRKWIAARRKTFFCGKKCANCNSKENLELDHKDPKTKVDHKVWSWSETRRLAELAKCQVLCRKCHRAKTEADAYLKPPHGTVARYVSHRWKCNCQLCRNAYAAARRVYRKTGKYPQVGWFPVAVL